MTKAVNEDAVRAWPREFEQILRRHCLFADPAAPIGADVSLTVLGMDSLQVLGMIVDIEDAFAVTVPDTMLTGDQFATPGSVWENVRGLIAGQ